MPRGRGDFGGLDLTHPLNRLAGGAAALAVNVRSYLRGTVLLRNVLAPAILTLADAIQTICRLNNTPDAGGPVAGFSFILAAGTKLYNAIAGVATNVATGLSGNQVSIVPFRPNTSPEPWGYVADSAPSPNVTIVADGFNCAGMLKVRSDGRTRKMGIAEPQQAATVTFPGGGSGPSLIYYRYVYRASETGALSNPSPVSIPGTNAQAAPNEVQPAANYLTNFSFNGAQWEFNSGQLRTKSPTPDGLLDYVYAFGFGFSIPAKVNIDGIQVDLNWLGQNAGTGTLATVSLRYLGANYGTPEFPGVLNQSFAADTLVGGSADKWGATLTPDIVNDPSFGFGIQITKQTSGGTNRSFINSMAVTIYYSTQDALITPTPSLDPQVDKIDIYRQSGGLANFTYVGTNPNTATAFNDLLSDLAVATNPLLEYDNFEPFPSIDLPKSGVVNIISQVLHSVSGDPFKIRYLPGTIMLLGSPTQTAYTAVRRPSSTTTWDFTNNDPNITPLPDSSAVAWNIAEPILAQQPLPYMFGPTDNINFIFAVGDPLRPGTLYWCKGSNLDSAPDTNQLEVTDPSEPLVNGAMSGGLGVLASIKRFWVIQPNFFNALATVTGTQGSTWSLQATSIPRGLFIARCLAVSGGGLIFFRVDDGIHVSPGGLGSQSITDNDLYPLFSHEGSTPQTVVRNGKFIYPPDDAFPNQQRFTIVNQFMYYDYRGTDGNYHTLVLDINLLAWVWDMTDPPTVSHASNEDVSTQGVLAGCTDGTLRLMATDSGAGESPTAMLVSPAIGGQGWCHIGQITIEYRSHQEVTMLPIVVDQGQGSYYGGSAITLPPTNGAMIKKKFNPAPNKFKLLQFQFEWTDPTLELYLEGAEVNMAPWEESYKPVQIFGNSGGIGGEL